MPAAAMCRRAVARLHHPWPKASRTPTTAISFAIISVPPASGDVHDPGDAESQDQKARHPGQEPVQQGSRPASRRGSVPPGRNSRPFGEQLLDHLAGAAE